MADTNTANLGLLIADLNDTFNFGAHVEANFTTIDGLMGAVQCTSGSRPTNTYAGQIIYETDSKRYAQNTGTKLAPVWTYMSHQAYAAASAARPTVGLTAGQLLYETDNFLLRTRGSGAWNGFLPVATSTALPGNPLAGDFAYLSDKDCVVRYTGTLWKLTSTAVCTSSTRPTVGIAAGTTIYETDTTRLLVYNGTTWEQKAFANFVCTSSTHPATPYTGLEIYETDTGLSAVYNGSNYEYNLQQIAPTQILGATTASITFSSVPAVTRLVLYWRARAAASGQVGLEMQIDGNTGNNYLWSNLQNSAGTAGAFHSGALVAMIQIGSIDGNTAGYFGSGQQVIDGWANATGFLTSSGHANSFSTTTTDVGGLLGGLFAVAGPHNSVKIFPVSGSFAAGSQFTLMGTM